MTEEHRPLAGSRWPHVLALSAVGLLAAVLGIGMLMAPRVADSLGFSWPVSRLHPLTYAWDMLAFLTFGSSFLLFRRAKRYLAPGADAARHRDPRPPILLVRSFRDDKTTIVLSGLSASPWGTNRTLEELVVEYLASHGPVVAIGRPGETLPPLGAAREYVDHGSWKQRIRELAAEAQLIVVLAGATEGLLWELRLIAEMGRLDRVLMVLPQMSAARAAAWAGIREVLTQVSAKQLPGDHDVVAKGLLLSLQQNGEVALLTGNGTERSYREALGTVMAQVRRPETAG